MRKDNGFDQTDPRSGQTFGADREDSMHDEERKLSTEQRLLRQQIPVNVMQQ